MKLLLLFFAFLLMFIKNADSIKSCQLDVVFCIDNSGSIGGFKTGGKYIKSWELVKEFAIDIIREMRIGPNRTQVGLVDFGDKAYPQFDLNEHGTAPEVMKALVMMDYRGELTNTSGGLKESRIMLSDPKFGSRGEEVPKLIILITDGDPTVDAHTLEDEVYQIRLANIHILAVGVTDKVNTNVMLKIVNNAEDFFRADTFSDLEKLKKYVVTDDLCERRNIVVIPTTQPTSAPPPTKTVVKAVQEKIEVTEKKEENCDNENNQSDKSDKSDSSSDSSDNSSDSRDSSDSSDNSSDKSDKKDDDDDCSDDDKSFDDEDDYDYKDYPSIQIKINRCRRDKRW